MKPIEALRRLPVEEPAPRTAQGRVLARVMATPAAATSGTPGSAPPQPNPPPGLDQVGSGALSTKAIVGGKLVLLGAGTLVVGAVMAISVSKPEVSLPRPDRSTIHGSSARRLITPFPAPVTPIPASATAADSVAPQETAPPAVHSATPKNRPARQVQGGPRKTDPLPMARNSLRLERQLVDGIRAQLAEDQLDSAAQFIREHERQFPSGVLTEEREVLAIDLLIRTHRIFQAQARATRFRQRYPKSFLLHAVEANLAQGQSQ